MTMKNKIALIMLILMTSILTITSMTSNVYADLPMDLTLDSIISMTTSSNEIYTFTLDLPQYTNGTEVGTYDKIQTNTTLVFSGIFLKDGQSFDGQEINIRLYDLSPAGMIFQTESLTTSINGVWSTDLVIDLPMSWDGVQITSVGLYIDEFGIEYLAYYGLFKYEFVLAEDACQEGYEPEIINEDGNFICNVTNEWHDSEMIRMQEIIDNMTSSNNHLVEKQRTCGEGTIQQGASCIVDVELAIESSNEPYMAYAVSSIVYSPNDMYCDKLGSSYDKVIIGTDGNDRIDTVKPDSEDLKTTRGNDLILAGAGHDYIRAGNGDDCIYGGTGNDIIIGGQDDDTIYGEDGDDSIKGQNGIDVIDGGYGFDICIAESFTNCE